MNRIDRISGDQTPPRDPTESDRARTTSPGSPPRRRTWLRPILLVLGAAILIGAIILGVSWWQDASHYESTDDAFIDTHIVRIAPQIAGRIVRVDVNDNQLVQTGQLLVEIDAGNAQTQLQQAQAQETQAEAQLQQARAQIRVAQDTYEQALSNAAAVAAQAQNAQTELNRYRELQRINPEAVAQQQIDQADAQARNTAAQREAANRQAQAQSAQRNTAAAQAQGAEAQVKALKALVAQAGITVGYERIVAPVSGHVAQRNAAPGNFVTTGQQMLAIVPLEMWITANFKETQLADMRPGQPVTIHVDACANADIRGHVDSIQRGAGQAFGILPPENATGNYVKVVQRVPVKIDLDTVPRDCPLGPGMSVEPTVRVR